MRFDLGPRRLCAEKYATVMSSVSGCDVTTVQQHYTGSRSRIRSDASLEDPVANSVCFSEKEMTSSKHEDD